MVVAECAAEGAVEGVVTAVAVVGSGSRRVVRRVAAV